MRIKFLVLALTVGLMLALATGCSNLNSRDVLTHFYDEKGNITKTVEEHDGFVTSKKAVNTGGEIEALSVEPAGGNTSGSTPMPNINLGGGAHGYQSIPAVKTGETGAPAWQKGYQSTVLDKIVGCFGITSGGTWEGYVGCPGESADQTAQRLAAFRSEKTAATSSSTTSTTPKTTTATAATTTTGNTTTTSQSDLRQ